MVSKHPEMSVVVPVLNESGNIEPLIGAIQEAFGGRNIEIIYVDDASVDSTAKELSAMKSKVPELRVLTHLQRGGQSAALRTGILAARSDLIGTLDGDGQNLPKDLLTLEKEVKAHRPGLVMAAGVRVKRQDGFSKRYAALVARKVRRWVLRDHHPDSGCATRVFDRALFLRMPYFNHIHRFMPSLARREGATVLAVSVGHAARTKGVSKYGTLSRMVSALSDVLGVMWLLYRSPKNLDVEE